MISDPRTAPSLPLARVIYGMAIAVVAAALLVFQPSEYGIKVAVLASLTVVCTFVPLLDKLFAPASPEPRSVTLRSGLSVLVAVAITLGVPVGTVALASNQQVVNIDGGVA